MCAVCESFVCDVFNPCRSERHGCDRFASVELQLFDAWASSYECAGGFVGDVVAVDVSEAECFKVLCGVDRRDCESSASFEFEMLHLRVLAHDRDDLLVVEVDRAYLKSVYVAQGIGNTRSSESAHIKKSFA